MILDAIKQRIALSRRARRLQKASAVLGQRVPIRELERALRLRDLWWRYQEIHHD